MTCAGQGCPGLSPPFRSAGLPACAQPARQSRPGSVFSALSWRLPRKQAGRCDVYVVQPQLAPLESAYLPSQRTAAGSNFGDLPSASSGTPPTRPTSSSAGRAEASSRASKRPPPDTRGTPNSLPTSAQKTGPGPTRKVANLPARRTSTSSGVANSQARAPATWYVRPGASNTHLQPSLPTHPSLGGPATPKGVRERLSTFTGASQVGVLP